MKISTIRKRFFFGNFFENVDNTASQSKKTLVSLKFRDLRDQFLRFETETRNMYIFETETETRKMVETETETLADLTVGSLYNMNQT